MSPIDVCGGALYKSFESSPLEGVNDAIDVFVRLEPERPEWRFVVEFDERAFSGGPREFGVWWVVDPHRVWPIFEEGWHQEGVLVSGFVLSELLCGRGGRLFLRLRRGHLFRGRGGVVVRGSGEGRSKGRSSCHRTEK